MFALFSLLHSELKISPITPDKGLELRLESLPDTCKVEYRAGFAQEQHAEEDVRAAFEGRRLKPVPDVGAHGQIVLINSL